MAVRAGHRHLRFSRLSGRHFAVALTPRGIGNMRRHRAALGTADAPVPLTADDLQLFGRHSILLAAPLPGPPAACSHGPTGSMDQHSVWAMLFPWSVGPRHSTS